MVFVLLIVEKREDRVNRPKDVGVDAFAQMVRFSEDLKARGVLRAVESLKTEGVRIESRGGKRQMIDGPFAESKELVGGFFLIDCATKDEALEIARQCPAAEWATVELRETGPCHGG